MSTVLSSSLLPHTLLTNKLINTLLTCISHGWIISLAKELYAHLREITKPGGEFVVRNFVGVVEDISVEASLV